MRIEDITSKKDWNETRKVCNGHQEACLIEMVGIFRIDPWFVQAWWKHAACLRFGTSKRIAPKRAFGCRKTLRTLASVRWERWNVDIALLPYVGVEQSQWIDGYSNQRMRRRNALHQHVASIDDTTLRRLPRVRHIHPVLSIRTFHVKPNHRSRLEMKTSPLPSSPGL